MQVHQYKIKAERENKHSIHASFRELNDIYKRETRKLEEEEEHEEEENDDEEEEDWNKK